MTLRGRIFTITISKKTDTQIFGIDKFGDDVIISVEDIKSMTPYDLNKRGVSIKN